MPSKKKSSSRLPDIAAKSTSKASLNTQNAPSPSAPSHSMASTYISTVVEPLEPLSHPDKIQVHNHPQANFDLFPQAEQNNMVPANPPRPAPQQRKAPPKRKPPANRKAPAATTEKRVTRARRSIPPSLAAKVFKASPLARAHLMACNPGVRHCASQGEASTTGQEGAFSTHSNILPESSSRLIQPQAERASTPIFLRPRTFPDVYTTLATLAEQGRHHQEPAITNQAHPPTNPMPWFPLGAAPTLAIPAQRPSQFSNNPRSPLNRSLFHDLPQKVTSMYPVPNGLEVSATQPAEDEDNFKRSIVTYRRLGLKFDDIAAKFHLGGFAADVVTAAAVEQSWRESDNKDFPPWYGDGVQKLRVFERDDPNYL